jgi:hypothetical protein
VEVALQPCFENFLREALNLSDAFTFEAVQFPDFLQRQWGVDELVHSIPIPKDVPRSEGQPLQRMVHFCLQSPASHHTPHQSATDKRPAASIVPQVAQAISAIPAVSYQIRLFYTRPRVSHILCVIVSKILIELIGTHCQCRIDD